MALEPGHRSPLYRSSHLAARFAPGLAQNPELLAVGHAMLVQQCQLGLGYPVVISEAHEQAVITGHDREEFRRMTLMLLERRGLPTPESAKSFSKRRPWV